MGTNLDSTQKSVVEYKKGIYEMGEYLVHRLFRIWLHSPIAFYFTPTAQKQRKVLNTLHSFTTNVIRERRQERNVFGDKIVVNNHDEYTSTSKKRLAMLDLLLSAESEGKINEMGIREEVDTFMFEVCINTSIKIMILL